MNITKPSIEWDVSDISEAYNPYAGMTYSDIIRLMECMDIHHQIGADFEGVVAAYLDESIKRCEPWNFMLDGISTDLVLNKYYLVNAHPDFNNIAKKRQINFCTPDFIGAFSSGEDNFLVPLDAKYSFDGRNLDQIKKPSILKALEIFNLELNWGESFDCHKFIPGRIIVPKTKANIYDKTRVKKFFSNYVKMIDLPNLGINTSNLRTMYYLADLFNINFDDQVYFEDKPNKELLGRDILYYVAEALNISLKGKNIDDIRSYIELDKFSLAELIRFLAKEKELENLKDKINPVNIKSTFITYLNDRTIPEREWYLLAGLFSSKLEEYYHEGKIRYANINMIRRSSISAFCKDNNGRISNVYNNINFWASKIETYIIANIEI